MSGNVIWPPETKALQPGGTHRVRRFDLKEPKLFLRAPREAGSPEVIFWTRECEQAGIWPEQDAEQIAAWLDGLPNNVEGHPTGFIEAKAEELPRPEEPMKPVYIRVEPWR